MRVLLSLLLLHAAPAFADWRAVESAAQDGFARMPVVLEVAQISGTCGADRSVNRDAAYCTSKNVIFLRRGATNAAYLAAHLMGHAAQVRHGVADRALAAIRADRSAEAAIRSVVVAQVECLAGMFVRRAGVRPGDWFDPEPFTGAHWGRDPLRLGPKMSVGSQARERAFGLGYREGVAACDALGNDLAPGLLIKAYRR